MFRTCRICFSKRLKKFSVIKLQCSHKFCKTCLRSHVNERLSKPLGLRCPDPSCGARLGSRDLQSFLSRRDYRRIEDLINRRILDHFPSFVMCAQPSCDGYGVLPLVSDEIHDRWKCPRCDLITCTNCRIPYHEGQSCQEYQSVESSSTPLTSLPLPQQKRLRLLRRHTKTCPHGHRTRKIPVTLLHSADGQETGSNHVRCAVCAVEFCWVCRSEYSRGHFNFRMSYCPIAELTLTLTVNNDVILSSAHLPQQINEYVVGDHDLKNVKVYSVDTNLVTHQGPLSSPGLLRPGPTRVIVHIRNGTVVQVVCPRGSCPFKLTDHAGITLLASPAPSSINPLATPQTPMTPAWMTPRIGRSRREEVSLFTPDVDLESPQDDRQWVDSPAVHLHEVAPPKRANHPFSTPDLVTSCKSVNIPNHSAPVTFRKTPHTPVPRKKPPQPINIKENPVGSVRMNVAKNILRAEAEAREKGQACVTPLQFRKVPSPGQSDFELDMMRSRILSNHLPSCLCRKCLLFKSSLGVLPSSYYDVREEVKSRKFSSLTVAQSPVFSSQQKTVEDVVINEEDQLPVKHPVSCFCSMCLGSKSKCSKNSSEVRVFLENFGKKPKSVKLMSESSKSDLELSPDTR
ncbi:hypothetical protein GEMRC1_003956 [Eukaryota sp. GEM-RC1]